MGMGMKNDRVCIRDFKINTLDATVMTHHNGGNIYINDNGKVEKLDFYTTNIQDMGNFLVSFLHRRGYPEPSIVIEEKTYDYVQPDDDIVINAIKCEFKNKSCVYPSNHPNYELFKNEKFSTDFKIRMYSNNDAINEILNHNQVSYDLVRKRRMVKLLQENVLRGHTIIKESLCGKWCYLYGHDGVRFAINIPKNPVVYCGDK